MAAPDARTLQLQAASTALIASSHVEPSADLAAERLRASFNVAQLAEVINGGPEVLEKRWGLGAGIGIM